MSSCVWPVYLNADSVHACDGELPVKEANDSPCLWLHGNEKGNAIRNFLSVGKTRTVWMQSIVFLRGSSWS